MGNFDLKKVFENEAEGFTPAKFASAFAASASAPIAPRGLEMTTAPSFDR